MTVKDGKRHTVRSQADSQRWVAERYPLKMLDDGHDLSTLPHTDHFRSIATMINAPPTLSIDTYFLNLETVFFLILLFFLLVHITLLAFFISFFLLSFATSLFPIRNITVR